MKTLQLLVLPYPLSAGTSIPDHRRTPNPGPAAAALSAPPDCENSSSAMSDVTEQCSICEIMLSKCSNYYYRYCLPGFSSNVVIE